jgi:hypothetical protein
LGYILRMDEKTDLKPAPLRLAVWQSCWRSPDFMLNAVTPIK